MSGMHKPGAPQVEATSTYIYRTGFIGVGKCKLGRTERNPVERSNKWKKDGLKLDVVGRCENSKGPF
jgi:hypothetical protein